MRRRLRRALRARALERGYLVSTARNDRRTVLEALEILKPVVGEAPLLRLGSAHDGGYLVPDDLEGLGAMISPGVSTEVGFDLEVAERGIPVTLLDASVARPPVAHELFSFAPVFLDAVDGETTRTLDTVVSESPPGDLMLQMDIEGAEYRVLNSSSRETLRRFRIIIVELHHLQYLLTSDWSGDLRSAFARLTRDHTVVHVHPNNYCPTFAVGSQRVPQALEVTLHRRDRFRPSTSRHAVNPHALDRPCDPAGPLLTLPPLLVPRP